MINKRYSAKAGKERWGFDIRLDGRRLRDYSFDTRRQAEDALKAIRDASRDHRYGIQIASARRRLEALIDLRLGTITRRPELVRATRVLKTFLGLLPAGIAIDEVTAADIRKFVTRRQADGQSAASINRELNIVGATLHAAASFFPELEQWRTPKIPRPPQSKRGRERLITTGERDQLLDHLHAPRKLKESHFAYHARLRVGEIFHFALLTGMRHGEINALRWSEIDWDGGEMKVIGTKTDSTRYIPITATVRDILMRRKAISKDPFVFTRGGGHRPKFYRILREACEACGIPYGRDSSGGLVLHDARHSATTRMLQAGIDLDTVGSITGHSDRALILYYGHATRDSKRRAAEALEDSLRPRIDPD
jgi:integrase